jgi:hypothetical protein
VNGFENVFAAGQTSKTDNETTSNMKAAPSIQSDEIRNFSKNSRNIDCTNLPVDEASFTHVQELKHV